MVPLLKQLPFPLHKERPQGSRGGVAQLQQTKGQEKLEINRPGPLQKGQVLNLLGLGQQLQLQHHKVAFPGASGLRQTRDPGGGGQEAAGDPRAEP